MVQGGSDASWGFGKERQGRLEREAVLVLPRLHFHSSLRCKAIHSLPFSHSELLSADHHSPWGGSKLQAGDGSTMALNALGFVHVCLRTGGALGTGALSVAKPLGASWC